MNYGIYTPHLPVVIAGLSGGGKSTVATEAERREPQEFICYDGRITTRRLRPGEVEGKDGIFGLSHEDFDRRAADTLFQYEKYGERYGFLRSRLQACLGHGNTFVIGGETETAADIKRAMNASPDETALKAVMVYIQRPLKDIMEGIVTRGGAEEENRKRIAHVTSVYKDVMVDPPADLDCIILNGKDRLQEAVQEMIAFVKSERLRQCKMLFGTSFILPSQNYGNRQTA